MGRFDEDLSFLNWAVREVTVILTAMNQKYGV
jgi:hypothetical protein